ncbi:MAG: phosphatase PAP2 family protein [Legionellaceae bacterium]|nr:phosphatase PAP2 family protein [Legionellaceae bacterium]
MPFILGLLLLGFTFGNRSLFYHASCVVFISTILNVALKVTFQVPLSPSLHQIGFAFPSGHMQLATVLYGWIALQSNNRLFQLLTIGLLAGIAFGIVHFGYHTWFDIFGAIFFAGLILSFYQILITYKKTYIFLGAFATTSLAMLYIAYRYTIPFHAWVAYCVLVLLIIAPKKLRLSD